jgi:hypothetical protein
MMEAPVILLQERRAHLERHNGVRACVGRFCSEADKRRGIRLCLAG